jgi:hypothetical protein
MEVRNIKLSGGRGLWSGSPAPLVELIQADLGSPPGATRGFKGRPRVTLDALLSKVRPKAG